MGVIFARMSNHQPRLKPQNRRHSNRLTYDVIPSDVKSIADRSVGRGVLQSMWRSHDDGVPYNLMWKIVDGRSVGFALFHYESVSNGAFTYRIGVIDMLCVAPEYRSRSYGAQITFEVLKTMSLSGVNRVELILREPAIGEYDPYPSIPPIGSERFLYDMGFRKVAYFPEFWKRQSERYRYSCMVCSPDGDQNTTHPDECTGVLMAMNES